MDDRAGQAAIHEGRIVIIRPIRKDLARPAAAQRLDRILLPGRGEHHDDDVRIHRQCALIAGCGHRGIFRRHVRQGAVQLEMPHLSAHGPRHRLRRTQLIPHEIAQRVVAQMHPPAPEPLKVGKAGMRADPNIIRHGKTHGVRHHVPVARMKPAGDIGRGDDLEQL